MSLVGPALPDSTLTPGAVRALDAAQVCARPLPPRPSREEWARLRAEVARRYGMSRAPRGWELDHEIPRCLGGADVVENLWLEPPDEAARKDRIEVEECRRACAIGTDAAVESAQFWFAEGMWSK